MKKIFNIFSAIFVLIVIAHTSNSSMFIQRNMGAISLEVTIEEILKNPKIYEAKDMTEQFKSVIENEHQKIYFLKSPQNPKWEEAAIIGSFYKGRLYYLEATFQPDYTKKVSWKKFLRKTKDYIQKPKKKKRESKKTSIQIYLKWEDSKTVLTYTKEKYKKGKKTYYYISLMDKKLFKSMGRDRTAKNCYDYASCYTFASKLLKQGKCRDAAFYWTQAIKHNPNDPWAWYHIAVVKNKMGQTKHAKKDFKKAVSLDKSFKDKNNGKGGPFDDYGPTVKCTDL